MNLRITRVISVATMIGLMFLFLLPFVPFTTTINCEVPPGVAVPSPCLFSTKPSYTGYESVGYLLIGRGATYSDSLGGYVTSQVGNLTAFGVLLTVVLPLVLACVGLLAPELVKRSQMSRAGLIFLGAFLAILESLSLFSMVSGGFYPPLGVLGIALLVMGVAMVIYGMHPWALHRQDAKDPTCPLSEL